MALAKKYHESVPSEDTSTYSAEIWEDGFVGSSTEICLELIDGLVGDWGKKGAPISADNWHRALRSELRLANEKAVVEDLLSGSDEQFQIRCYVSGSIWWSTYLMPDTIRKKEHHDHSAIIQGHDGIELLKRKIWAVTPGVDTPLQGIADILALLDLGGLAIKTANDIYPVSSLTSSDDPIDNVDHDWDHVKSEIAEMNNGFVSAYSILAHVCKRYRLRLTQAEGGFWLLEQRHTKFNSTQNIFQYDSTGAQDTPHQSTITALAYDETNVRQSGAGEVGLRKSYNSVRLTYEHGTIREKVMTNPGFSYNPALGSGSRYTGWTDNFVSGGFGGYPSNNTPGSTGNPAKTAAGMPIVKHSWPTDDADLINTLASVSVPYITQVSELIGGGTDDKLIVQLQFLARGFSTLEAAIADSFYAFWSLKYNGLWLNKNTFTFDDATLGQNNKIPLQFQLDTLAGVNEEFDVSGAASTVELRLHGPIDFQTPQTEANPTFIDKASWNPVVVDFLEGAAENNLRKSTIVYSPSVDLDSLDDKLEDQSFFIGDGPTSVHDGRIRLSSDGSRTTEWKLSNGTADGSELGLDRLWGKLELRQQVVPVDMMYQRFPIGSTPWTIQRHLTYDGFNWDAVYFRKDYRSSVVLAEVVKLRFDSVSEGAIVSEDPDLDGTYYPPTGELPPTRDFIGGFNGLSCIPPDDVAAWAMWPMIESSVDGEVRNYNEDFAALPHGTIVSPGGTFLTFDEVEGLISTDTGTTRHVPFAGNVIGDTLQRFQFIGQNIRKGTSEETVLYITAGTAGVYKVAIQPDGTCRASVTSNGAESTVNVDSTLAVPVGRSYQWAIQVELSGSSPSSADIWLWFLNDAFAWERIHGVQTDPCSGEFTAIYALYGGTTSSRFLYAEGNSTIRSGSELREVASCILAFARSKGGTTFGVNHDAYLVTDNTKYTVYDKAGAVLGQVTHGLTLTHYGRSAFDPINAQFVIVGLDGKVYSWAIGDGSVTLEHDFGGTIKARGVYWSPAHGQMFVITEDSGSGDFGHFPTRTGTWAYTSLDTSFEFVDFAVMSSTRLYALKSNGDLGLYAIATDGSLSELDTLTPGTGNLPSGTIVAVDWRNGQGYFAQYNDGSIGYLVEETDLSGDWFTALTSAHVFGSPGLALDNSTLFGYACTSISAADHIVRFPFDDLNLGTSDVIDKGAVGATLRGLAMARVGTAPPGPVTDLAITATTSTTFSLTWTDPGQGETGIKIWHRQNDSGPWLFKENVAVGTEAVTVTGYGPEELWCFKAQPFNFAGAADIDACNSDCDTTLASTARVFAAVANTAGAPTGPYQRIYEIDAGDAGVISYHDISGSWPVTSANKHIAYHPVIDRFLYINAAGDLRSVRLDWDAHTWDTDTLAYAIGGIDNIHSMWVDTDGNVVIERGTTSTANGYIKFSYVDDITGNVDSAWNAPTLGSSAGDYRDDSQDSNAGGNRVGLRSTGIWTLLPPAGFTVLSGTSDANDTCAYEVSASRIIYYTDSNAIKIIPQGGGSTTTIIADAGSLTANIFVHNSLLYYAGNLDGLGTIRRAASGDGSGDGLWYTHPHTTNVTIKSLIVVTAP